MVLTSKGQVTIPLEIRLALGLLPGTEVDFDIVEDSVRIRKAGRQLRGSGLVEHLRAAGRRAPGPSLSTDQILALTRGE